MNDLRKYFIFFHGIHQRYPVINSLSAGNDTAELASSMQNGDINQVDTVMTFTLMSTGADKHEWLYDESLLNKHDS